MGELVRAREHGSHSGGRAKRCGAGQEVPAAGLAFKTTPLSHKAQSRRHVFNALPHRLPTARLELRDVRVNGQELYTATETQYPL